MKKLHVVLSAIVGAVLGLALHRTLMSYWSLASWLSPVFMFVSAIIGVVFYDPVGCWGVVKKSFKQAVEKVPSWEEFKSSFNSLVYDFASTQIFSLSCLFMFFSWFYLLMYVNNITSKLTLQLHAIIFSFFWALVSVAALGTSEGKTGISLRNESKKNSLIPLSISSPVVILYWTPKIIFYWVPRWLMSIPYKIIFEFLVTFTREFTANSVIFVGSCRETLVVAFGSAIGYIVGFLSGDFLVCATVGGLVALVAILVPKVGPIYSWAQIVKMSIK